MDSEVKLYLERAENKIILSKTSFEISIENFEWLTFPKEIASKFFLENFEFLIFSKLSIDNKKKEQLGIPSYLTFYNDVISQAYYAIFYIAKAYLLSKGIRTKPPEEHKKTYEEFKKLVYSNEFNRQLVEIYESESAKAETLLNIFFEEKKKRGRFTYNVNSNANIPYAKESIENAVNFVSLIKSILEK